MTIVRVYWPDGSERAYRTTNVCRNSYGEMILTLDGGGEVRVKCDNYVIENMKED